ncbi:hypothetical protein [Falsiruegeria mediterranea]|uniref:hypothetical protein n=1 Tax=Falsiruegeria mediterranea TaxID=1280832 RepID=UPI0015F27067|nr:hypothetical protein [Falsiruegeria mediterranea]
MGEKTRPNALTKEEFIRRAEVLHGKNYGYEGIDYKNLRTHVTIVCFEHGPFQQRPHKHLEGQGCPVCGRQRVGRKLAKKNHDGFEKRARAVHSDKYEYHDVAYLNAHTKVKITCPEHGVFEQTPNSHWQGNGCAHCAGQARITHELFLQRAKDRHGETYEYELPEAFDRYSSITIVCADHGVFQQRVSHHLDGSGCPHCSGVGRLNIETFVERAQTVHGDLYDYRRTVFVACDKHLKVVCREHGAFSVTPNNHFKGRGCPTCYSSGYERRVRYWLDEASISYQPQWSHKGCCDKGPLRFDFFLSEHNLLIEVDGQHHFKPVYWSNSITDEDAESNLRATQRRDRIKTRWAARNGIELMRIRYDEDIECRLETRLKEAQ